METAPRHKAWPYRLGTNGAVTTVQQDTDADIEQCLEVAFVLQPGTRRDLPDFGVPDELFLQGGPDLEEVRAALKTAEPRADEDVHLDDARLLGMVGQVQVGYELTGTP